jgi:membrane protease YdiL (CAAX protease family)
VRCTAATGTLAGIAFALVLARRGNLLDTILAHAIANGCLAAYAVATGDQRAWS